MQWNKGLEVSPGRARAPVGAQSREKQSGKAQKAESKQSLSFMGDGLRNGTQLPGAPGKGRSCEALWRDSLRGLPHICALHHAPGACVSRLSGGRWERCFLVAR